MYKDEHIELVMRVVDLCIKENWAAKGFSNLSYIRFVKADMIDCAPDSFTSLLQHCSLAPHNPHNALQQLDCAGHCNVLVSLLENVDYRNELFCRCDVPVEHQPQVTAILAKICVSVAPSLDATIGADEKANYTFHDINVFVRPKALAPKLSQFGHAAVCIPYLNEENKHAMLFVDTGATKTCVNIVEGAPPQELRVLSSENLITVWYQSSRQEDDFNYPGFLVYSTTRGRFAVCFTRVQLYPVCAAQFLFYLFNNVCRSHLHLHLNMYLIYP